jgi:ADP-heptose:LPS heptosyltransferase
VDKILIIKPSSLGDIVHTLPAVHFLKQTFPNSKISWVINSEWAPLLNENADVDSVIAFPRSDFRGPAGPLRFFSWSRQFAKLRPDLVLDFQGLLRSAWMARLSKGARILGLSDAREGARWVYTETAVVDSRQHAVDRYLELAKLAGSEIAGPALFPLPEGKAIRDFEYPARAVILHPFARGAGKSLTGDEVFQLSRLLAPLPVIVIGKSDQDLRLDRNATSLVNETSLEELIWLLRRAAFIISVDSGPMHIAAGLTANLLSIHLWSDPRRVGPYNPDAWIWKDNQIIQIRSLGERSFSARLSSRPAPLQIARFVHDRLEGA